MQFDPTAHLNPMNHLKMLDPRNLDPRRGIPALANLLGFGGGEKAEHGQYAGHATTPGGAWANTGRGKSATKAAPVVKSLFGVQAQPQAQQAQQQPMVPMMGMGQMGMQQPMGQPMGMQGGMGMQQGGAGMQPQFQQWLQGGQRQPRQGMLRPEQMVRQDW